jgi:hypothetical protein
MWAGILYVGAIRAAGTMLVLDASLPGGLIESAGNLPYAQTMAFSTLVFFSLSPSSTRAPMSEAHSSGCSPTDGWGSGSVVALVASRGGLRAVSAAGVFDYQPERGRLAVLRGGWKLGAMAARVEQVRDAKETFKAAGDAVGN